MNRPTCLLTLCLVTSPCLADRDQTQAWTLNLYVENDLFSETDQDYSSGIRLSWVSPDVEDYLQSDRLPAWVKRVNRRLRFFHDAQQGLERNVTVSLGQLIYTPRDAVRRDLIKADRPYAGWLFMGLGYQTTSDRQLDTLELRLGIVGPAALGQKSQDLIHDVRGFDRFQGWGNQLRNEPGLVAVWEHKRKQRRVNPETRVGMDVIGHGGVALGNVRSHVNAGAEFRFGWALPDDFGTSAIRPGGENSTPNATWDPRLVGENKWGLHVFAAFDVRLVGQDIFLDGNSFKTSHSVTREILVADAALGASYIYGGVKLSYAHVFRTREFTRQAHAHSFGSLAFSYTFRKR